MIDFEFFNRTLVVGAGCVPDLCLSLSMLFRPVLSLSLILRRHFVVVGGSHVTRPAPPNCARLGDRVVSGSWYIVDPVVLQHGLRIVDRECKV